MQIFQFPKLKLDVIRFIWVFFPQKHITGLFENRNTELTFQAKQCNQKKLTSYYEYNCELLVNSVRVIVATNYTIIYL